MRRSLLALLVAALVVASCSLIKKPNKAPHVEPSSVQHTAALDLLPAAHIVAQAVMPPGFAPVAPFAPFWLEDGKMVAAIGSQRGRTIVVGFRITDLKKPLILAADYTLPNAPDGRIVAVAPSPSSMAVALAFNEPKEGRVEAALLDLFTGQARRVADFTGQFGS